MMQWMLLPLRRYTDFAGRSRRKEFWMYLLGLIILFFIMSTLDTVLGLGGSMEHEAVADPNRVALSFNSHGGFLTILSMLATIVPSIAVSVRRLHDLDKSGWWLLIGLIPIVGGLVLLYFYVQPGMADANRYGPPPVELLA